MMSLILCIIAELEARTSVIQVLILCVKHEYGVGKCLHGFPVVNYMYHNIGITCLVLCFGQYWALVTS